MKIRINDLARELEVKSKAILDVLTKVGVTEKKTHSSSIEEDEAEQCTQVLCLAEPGNGQGIACIVAQLLADEFRPKIDLSKISKPGDVLKAITEQAAHPPGRRACASGCSPSQRNRQSLSRHAPAAPPKTLVTKPAAPPRGSLRQRSRSRVL